MTVNISYDEKRYKLLDTMDETLEQARELLNPSIWGYESMNEDYALNLYIAIKKVKDMV